MQSFKYQYCSSSLVVNGYICEILLSSDSCDLAHYLLALINDAHVINVYACECVSKCLGDCQGHLIGVDMDGYMAGTDPYSLIW